MYHLHTHTQCSASVESPGTAVALSYLVEQEVEQAVLLDVTVKLTLKMCTQWCSKLCISKKDFFFTQAYIFRVLLPIHLLELRDSAKSV